MPTIIDVVGSYRQTFTTGAVTAIAAGTGVAGHLLALRWANANAAKAARIKTLQAEFLLTTAFGAAQEVGYDAYVMRAYTVTHTAATGTALSFGTNDGKLRTQYAQSGMAGRIASAAALTNGTHTLDGNAIARGGAWCAAVGSRIEPTLHDFTKGSEPGGILLQNEEGLVVRNTILMGATGVGKWHFTVEWDEVLLGS